jgi:hypothetical protein
VTITTEAPSTTAHTGEAAVVGVTTIEAPPSPIEGPPARWTRLHLPKRRLAIGAPLSRRGSWAVLRNLAVAAVIVVLFAGSLLDIADFVGLRDGDDPGQELAQSSDPPVLSGATDATNPVNASTSVAPPADGPRSYTVLRGDFLYDIARRHGTTTQALVELNAIPNPNRIEVGQVIVLPPVIDED